VNFIIATDLATRDQQDAITKWAMSTGWGYWHWIENFWILSNVPAGTRPRDIYQVLSSIPLIGGLDLNLLVIEIGQEIPYYGSLPTKAWDWFYRYGGISK
jgi:hypothetical protein